MCSTGLRVQHGYYDLHMPQLMSDCEGGANSILLADGAAPVLVAHGPQLRKPCKVTSTQIRTRRTSVQ